MKVEDFKTTVWVVKAWFLAVISIFMILFVKEVSNGILPAIGSLYYDLVEKVLSYLF